MDLFGDSAWRPERAAAVGALKAFVPHAGPRYARYRNYDRGPGKHDGVSGLSPWIRHRIVLEPEVLSAVLQQHSLDGARKFVEEVFWRTYWKGWLEHRPVVWSGYRQGVRNHRRSLEENPGLGERLSAAVSGQTDIECFDAWLRELVTTGYLHNHARMWFASIWIFTLRLPWELGADLFLRHLLDGDAASNTLSWRWVAGIQTRGKSYLARPDNIARYTEGRFGKVAGLSSNATPLQAAPPPPPRPPGNPAAPEEGVRTGLLITEDDLSPGFITDGLPGIDCVVALRTSAHRSPGGVSERVDRFIRGAMDDAIERCGIGDSSVVADGEGVDGIESVAAWARERGLRQIVTPYAPVGPAATAVASLSDRLAEEGIGVARVRREWDEACWPHATRGFFHFRKHIPALVRELVMPHDTRPAE